MNGNFQSFIKTSPSYGGSIATKMGLPFLIMGLFIFSAHAQTAPPIGYLIPMPASIPSELVQNKERLYSPCSKDSYVLEYTKPGGQLLLSITENAESPPLTYDAMLQGYELTIRQFQAHPGNSTLEKVQDIERLGARGAMFYKVSYGAVSYDIVLDDEGRLFRIQAHDREDFHFSKAMITNIVSNLVRQESLTSTFCR